MSNSIKAVFWDFGGVFTSSPFESFQQYEKEHQLPEDFIRSVNTSNSHDNAWARLERNSISIDEFDDLFAQESEAMGYRVPGKEVLRLLSGIIRPAMVDALDTINQRFLTACLTNNFSSHHDMFHSDISYIMEKFNTVVESSKVNSRKPEPEFYLIACDTLKVNPEEVVFLDDLGINLKPAKELGMTTIKVTGQDQALGELSEILNMEL